MVFLLFSCTSAEYGYIEKAEIIDATTIHIYFSGNVAEIDPTYDIGIVVNNVQNYHIKNYSYNMFQDNIGGLKRFRCTLNKNLLAGDKVEITGLGRSVYGKIIVNYPSP
jgi:hypothetical protein